MKYDVETLEAELFNLVKSKFPAKLTEITLEKSDGITLDIPTDDQYFNSTDDEVDNRTISVRYGLEDQAPSSVGGSTAEDNIYIFLVFLNEINQQTGIVRKKLFRYIRALKEIFEENSDSLQCVSSLKIRTIAPQSWTENENSAVYKVGGVYIETAIAS
jgi:hypothetical protein